MKLFRTKNGRDFIFQAAGDETRREGGLRDNSNTRGDLFAETMLNKEQDQRSFLHRLFKCDDCVALSNHQPQLANPESHVVKLRIRFWQGSPLESSPGTRGMLVGGWGTAQHH